MDVVTVAPFVAGSTALFGWMWWAGTRQRRQARSSARAALAAWAAYAGQHDLKHDVEGPAELAWVEGAPNGHPTRVYVVHDRLEQICTAIDCAIEAPLPQGLEIRRRRRGPLPAHLQSGVSFLDSWANAHLLVQADDLDGAQNLVGQPGVADHMREVVESGNNFLLTEGRLVVRLPGLVGELSVAIRRAHDLLDAVESAAWQASGSYPGDD